MSGSRAVLRLAVRNRRGPPLVLPRRSPERWNGKNKGRLLFTTSRGQVEHLPGNVQAASGWVILFGDHSFDRKSTMRRCRHDPWEELIGHGEARHDGSRFGLHEVS